MCFKFSFHSIVPATFALGTLLSCGGGGNSGSKDELPYVLPAGTEITIICGTPTQHFITPAAVAGGAPPVERPMTPLEIADVAWTTRQFTLTVAADGIASWQIWGLSTGSQFKYTRTSPTTFDVAVSWSGGVFSFSQCEIPKLSSVYGSVGRWEYWQTNSVAVANSSIRFVGGGTAEDQLQYQNMHNSNSN